MNIHLPARFGVHERCRVWHSPKSRIKCLQYVTVIEANVRRTPWCSLWQCCQGILSLNRQHYRLRTTNLENYTSGEGVVLVVSAVWFVSYVFVSTSRSLIILDQQFLGSKYVGAKHASTSYLIHFLCFLDAICFFRICWPTSAGASIY